MKRICLLLSALFLLASCKHDFPSGHSAGSSQPRALPSGAGSATGPILSYANVVDRVAPAVVTIHAQLRVRAPQQFPFFDDPFFQQFFGGRIPRQPRTETEQALGSGVIVRSDGYLLTNHHVIDGAENITVDMAENRRYKATVVGSDSPSDLAVLKIGASDLPVLQLADSDTVRVGDICLAVGNPLGIGQTVTAGIVSAKGRSTESGSGSFQDFLQTDAPINKGNSGGALVNTRGELIGINSQILSPNGGGNIGIGFAIPSNMARNVMNQLIGKGLVRRGMLGVTIQQMTPELAQSLGLPNNRGILIGGVTPGGPGDKAGLQRGDVVLKLNGKDVNDLNELRNQVAAMGPDVEVTLSILREGSHRDVRVRLGELTEQSARSGAGQGGGAQGGKLGITVVPLTPDIAAQLGVSRNTRGVAIESVDPDGPAAQAGLRPGDIIQEVNRQPIRTPAEIGSALERSGNRAPLLLINRGGQTLFVAVPLG